MAEVFVAVISYHGKPGEVRLFEMEAEAREFARYVAAVEDWGRMEPFDPHAGLGEQGHEHSFDWLEDWGDGDGCGVVAGPAVSME